MNPAVQCKPKAVTFPNSTLRDTIGRLHLGGSSETTGTQLKNTWGLYKAIGSRQLGGVGVEWKTTERIERAHLEQKPRSLEDHVCKTTRWQVGNNILKDDWETTGRQMEDTWKQWGRPILGNKWKLWKANGRQLGNHPFQDKWKTTRQQLKKAWGNWETTPGKPHLGKQPGRHLRDKCNTTGRHLKTDSQRARHY